MADEDGKLASLIRRARDHYACDNLHRHPNPIALTREIERREHEHRELIARARRREEFDLRREEAASSAAERLATYDLQADLDALLADAERDAEASMMLPSAPRVTHKKTGLVKSDPSETRSQELKSPSGACLAAEAYEVRGIVGTFSSTLPSPDTSCLSVYPEIKITSEPGRVARRATRMPGSPSKAEGLGSRKHRKTPAPPVWSKPLVSPFVPETAREASWLATNIYPILPLHPLAKKNENQRIHLRHEALTTKQKLQWVSHCLAPLKHQGHRHGAVSLNLSHDLELQVLKRNNQLDWLWRRLQRSLKHAGLQCRLVLVIERTTVTDPSEQDRRRRQSLPPFSRLHAHAEAACPSAAFLGVREALLDAAGRWSDEAGAPRGSWRASCWDKRQLVWRDNPDSRWLSRYCIKQADTYAITRGLAAEARALYEEYRLGENMRRLKRASKKTRERLNAKQCARRRLKKEVAASSPT